MSSRSDMILALTAAAGLHAAVFLSVDLPGGGIGSGAGGAASISLAAATPGFRAAVAAWERPPAVFENLRVPRTPAAEMTPELPGTWDDTRARSSPTRVPGEPAPAAVPKTVAETSVLPAAPKAGSVGSQISTQGTVALKPPAPAMPLEAVPDTRPIASATPEPPDRALMASERPQLRPAKIGGDEAVTRRVAEGAGGGVSHGPTPNAVARTTVSPNAVQAAQAVWAAAIHKRIARHQRFPRRARGTGRVRLTMVIQTDGRLSDVRVATSSGNPDFDRAAVDAAQKAAPFPAAPNALRQPWYRVGQWVNFGQ